MSKGVIEGVLKEELWKRVEEKMKERLSKDEIREMYDTVYEESQEHLMDVMREIYENDIDLFNEFFE